MKMSSVGRVGLCLMLAAAVPAQAQSSLSASGVSASNISLTTLNGFNSASFIIPTGAVMAFDLASCPTGWTEYTAARGRFLRGIDNGAGNDPNGTRAAGATQTDAMQGHVHTSAAVLTNASAGWNLTGGGGQFISGPVTVSSSAAATDGSNGAPRLSSETRPKNVAVLFCRKD